MIFFFVGLTAVLLVGILSRDRDLTASQETVVTAELNLDDAAVRLFPDHVRLVRCSPTAFSHPDQMGAATEGLRAEGFTDVGAFGIDEMAGVRVRLMVNTRQSLTATLFDHAGVGVWAEAASRYEDGHRWLHTTLAGRGLEPRPGTTMVSLPGVSLAELLARARGDRPGVGLKGVNVLHAAPHWEQDYADWVAARKARMARDAAALGQDPAGDKDQISLAA